jgi:hypothetical protein
MNRRNGARCLVIMVRIAKRKGAGRITAETGL